MGTNLTLFGTAAVIVFALVGPAHAQNGKNPRGVNPVHYQCYTVEAPTNEATLKTLRDQFGTSEGVKLD